MKKKIAVYICGQYRTFDTCKRLFFENVVNQNLDFDFDFFCRINIKHGFNVNRFNLSSGIER